MRSVRKSGKKEDYIRSALRKAEELPDSKHKNEIIKDSISIIRMVHKLCPSYLTIMVVYQLLSAAIPFISIVFSSMILDGIVNKLSKGTVLTYVYVMVICNLVLGLTVWALSKVMIVKQRNIDAKVDSSISEKALTLDYDILERKETLEKITRAKEGSNSHGGITSFCNLIGDLIKHVSTLIYAISLLIGLFVPVNVAQRNGFARFMNSYFSFFTIMSFIIFVFLVIYQIGKLMSKIEYAFFEENIEINRKFGYFFEFIWNYKLGKDLRLYNMSDMVYEEMKGYQEEMAEKAIALGRWTGKLNGLIGMINHGILLASYVYVGAKAILHLITVGNLLMYVNSLQVFVRALNGISDVYVQIGVRCQYLKNYSDFLQIENRKYEGSLPVEKRTDNEYELEFRNVSFRYPNNEELILKNVSMKVHVGKKMAIVGKNGAGKTTFIKLLCRLYDPTEGQILLNGIDIRKYDYQEYLKLFAVVFQDFHLFSFSVGQNVATSVEFDNSKVMECLEQAGMKEQVEAMPDCTHTNLYQTQENGIEISGGEAQKIAIARALYKDSPIVILDEPTSALDPISEYEI
ncbi:MAG TPA: ABC transporter ATP-binding protein, partial [Lachnospiraceae bacterium]|nr:ABC transporter ATP-binding protein [Lachnospiraceae bacterium]